MGKPTVVINLGVGPRVSQDSGTPRSSSQQQLQSRRASTG